MKRLAYLALCATAATLLAACDRPSDLPDGSVSRTKVDFEAPAAGGNPSAETLFVSNSGRGALEAPTVAISYENGADWLTVTVTSSGDKYAIAVQPVTTGLVAATYRATLKLSWASGSAEPAQVIVTLVVPVRSAEAPRISLSRTTVELQAPGASGDPQVEHVWVANDGGGTLATPTVELSYQDRAGWLSADVSVTGAPYDVTLKAATAGLAPGVYRATVTLTCAGANASPAQVSVTLTVPDARFDLSVDALAIGAPRGGGDPEPAVFQIVNAGHGTLPVPQVEIAYAGAKGWLTAAVTGTPAAYTVTAQAAVTGLSSGVHTATLTIRASGAAVPPRTLPVTLTVPPPEVAVSTHELALVTPGADLDAVGVVSAMNAGGGELAVPVATVTYDAGVASWDGMLAVSVTGSRAPYRVEVTAHQLAWRPSSGGIRLAPGTYGATVQLAAPGAAVSDTFHVTFRVEMPQPRVTPTEVAFSEYPTCPLPAPTAVWVIHRGGGTLPVPAVAMDPGVDAWLVASVAASGPNYAIALRLKAYPVQPGGTVDTTIMVVDPTGVTSPVPVRVRFEALRPSLSSAMWTAQLDVRAPRGVGDPAPRALSLSTPDGCFPQPTVEVAYASETDPAWISSIIIASTPHQHDVSLVTTLAGLEAGQQRAATVRLRIGGSAWDVPVTQALGVAPAGPLQSLRFSTALPSVLTPLADGRALLTGGGYGAELFDPVTRTWMTLNAPASERARHGAVQLEDGRVLLCGGDVYPGGTHSSTCEVLADTQWSTLGSLTVARSDVTLVTMPRGRVLVVSSLATPEVLDIATGRSALLDGVYGTAATKRPDGSILVAGGGTSAWLYSPELDTWAATGDLAFPRDQPALIPLPDGRVLAMGDRVPASSDARTQIWDPSTGRWSTAASSPTIHERTSVVLLSSGKVLATSGHIAGGLGGSTQLELFDPATGKWSATDFWALKYERSSVAIARLTSGLVVFAGGNFDTSSPTGTTETYTW